MVIYTCSPYVSKLGVKAKRRIATHLLAAAKAKGKSKGEPLRVFKAIVAEAPEITSLQQLFVPNIKLTNLVVIPEPPNLKIADHQPTTTSMLINNAEENVPHAMNDDFSILPMPAVVVEPSSNIEHHTGHKISSEL
eukprot:2535692-Amphidinium_carterae.1